MTEARVSLFDGLLPSGINSHCDAYVDKDGDLVIETQDLGEAVRAIFGDSDYEYWIRVRAPQTTRLAELLEG